MVDPNLFIPLSPPISPRMSAYHPGSDSEWHEQSKPFDPTCDSESNMALVHSNISGLDMDMKRPMLRSHKTFPYQLRNSGCGGQQPDTPLHSSGTSPSSHLDGLGIDGLDNVQQNDLSTVTFGGSAPASPVSNPTMVTPDVDKSEEHPQHDEEEEEDSQQDLNGLDLDGEDDDIGEDEPQKPMSAAELRAQKRKMKRFR